MDSFSNLLTLDNGQACGVLRKCLHVHCPTSKLVELLFHSIVCDCHRLSLCDAPHFLVAWCDRSKGGYDW